MLPGGVHLFLGDADHIETLSHRSPHICIYSRSTESDWRKDYNDIHLLPPGQPRISRTDGREFGLSRGPGDLAAFYAPVRRVTVGAHGVPHSLAFERDTEPRDGSTVGDAFIRALHMAGTLGGTTMSTGWSIELPEELDYLWNVVPGGQIDPAVLVQYVNVGFSSGQARVLWDYSMSLTGAMNSYFVLSQVPESVAIALNGSPVLAGQPVGLELVRELSEVGLAVGSESLRSSTNALGVIGVVAAIRLFTGHNETPRPLRNGARSRGFLLPVDSFKEILGDGLDSPDGGNARRADLIAMQLKLAEPGGLHILFSAIECKYTSYTLPAEKISSALEQAARTSERLLELANAARHSSGIPERLALVALISFGLRLRACTDDSEVRTESEILKHLINGTFDVSLSGAGNVVVVTECQGDSGSWVRGKGMIIRLTPGHWPGIGDSPEVLGIQRQLSIQFGWQADGAPASEPVADRLPSPHAPSNDVDSTPTLVPVEQVDSPLPTAIPAGPVALRSVERLRPILLGTDSELRPITFDPQSERRPLDNYNMLISGSSGKGKTQLIKALVAQLRQQDRNVMMLDFKNDFASDRVFLELSHMDCRYVTFDGLPYNPLVPMPITHPATGTAVLQISQHISGISSVLAKTFGLGAQQESSLKDVIRECYRTRGLDPIGNIPYRDDLNFPDFNDIGEALRNNNPSAYNRMDPLFDLGVFSSANRLTTFEAVVSGSIVIDLSQIQSDTIKNAIAKLLVLSAHAYYNARPHSSIPRQFLVFDEAHRVLDSEFLVRFVRECRAYGVGVLLSSQYPTDFPQEVSASLNTKVVHGNGVERERVRDILRMLGGSVHETSVSQLGLFDAFVSSPHYHSIKIRTLSYPHYLLLMSLRTSSGIRRIDLQVDGIDTQRLSLPYLLDALIEMGLAVDDGGILRAV
jgi:DNA phosphorothioation-dependent restriction protein DptH